MDWEMDHLIVIIDHKQQGLARVKNPVTTGITGIMATKQLVKLLTPRHPDWVSGFTRSFQFSVRVYHQCQTINAETQLSHG